jgi:hypothetical protein
MFKLHSDGTFLLGEDIVKLFEGYLKWEYWFIATENIKKPFCYIQKLVLLMGRNAMYKHDFLVQLQNIYHHYCDKRMRQDDGMTT